MSKRSSRDMSLGEMIFAGLLVFALIVVSLVETGYVTMKELANVWDFWKVLGTPVIYLIIALIFVFGAYEIIDKLVKK